MVAHPATYALRFILLLLIIALPCQTFGSGRETVYDKQKTITEKELLTFLDILPEFRSWTRAHHEEAHPMLTDGRPDFLYSANAERWIKARGWSAKRFFCIMGKMAAALVIIEEGNDFKGTRPRDMPKVNEAELALARKHLGRMLEAGGATAKAAPSVAVEKPTLPRR